MWYYGLTRLRGNTVHNSGLIPPEFRRGPFTKARLRVSADTLRQVLLIVLIISLGACSKTEPPPSSPPGPIAANANANVDVELVEALRVFEGRFDWRSDLGDQGRYVFEDIDKLRALVEARNPDLALNTLVGCIDDLRPARSVLDGKKTVVVGAVCYEAVTLMVIHEETDATGDIAQTWAGHIEPTATPSVLANAKQAWLQVLKDKSYGFP